MSFTKKTLWAVALAVTSTFAQAGAVRLTSEFNDFTLPRNDDGSTGLVNIGFGINFFGVNRSQLYVNNNGNVTLDEAMPTYTPFALANANRQILAPFFADVDTRGAVSLEVKYGTGTADGRNAFGVNWVSVGYFANGVDKLNSFQLIMIDRSDTGAGNFDFEFNYDQILWETGSASGGTGGLGGNSARVGWSNGNLDTFELQGSAVNGALLDSGASALISHSLGSDVDGRYVWQVRNGQVIEPPVGVAEPATLLSAGLGLLVAGAASRRRRRSA